MNCHNRFERRIGALFALSLVSAVMLAASCGGEDDKMRTSAPEKEVKPVDSRPARNADDGNIRRESQALHVLITVNDAEVAHGTLAQSKASAQSVKDYASQMVTEHGAATERLASLAQQKGITPEANPVSDALKRDADTIKARLEGLSGAAFDKDYIDGQILMHVKARAIIDDQLTPAMVDPELKSTLSQLRTSIEGHLLEAQKLHGTLGGDAGMGGDSGTSTSGGPGPGWPDGGLGRDASLTPRDSGLGSRDGGLELPDPNDLVRDD
jgi:putative membrane protein